MEKDLSSSETATFDATIGRALSVIYGPALVALLFAVLINIDQSHEVIHSSFSDFYSNAVGQSYKLGVERDFNAGEALLVFLVAVVRVFFLASVPFAVVASSRWALREAGFPVGRLSDMGVETHFAAAIPRYLGALCWLGYVVALFQGLELWPLVKLAAQGEFIGGAGTAYVFNIWWALGFFLLTSLVFTIFLMIWLVLWSRVEDAPGRGALWWGLHLSMLAFVVVMAGFPQWAWVWGPLASTAGLFAILAYLAAALSVETERDSLPFPLIFVVIWLVSVSSGAGAALMWVFGVGAFAFGGLIAGAFPALRNGEIWEAIRSVPDSLAELAHRLGHLRDYPAQRWAVWLLLASLAAVGLHGWHKSCASLSGCNVARGVPVEGRVYSSPSAALHSFDAQEGADPTSEILIVAARGGGIYAAYHTAYFLARLADEAPEAADNLFAVSGISGGSVGAGLYWTVRASGVCQRPGAGAACHQEAIRAILKRDFLAPIFATLFTRDLFDSILPISAVTSAQGWTIDRGAVFERELARAVDAWWEDVSAEGENPLREGFTAATSGRFPLLILSTVDVDQGSLHHMSAMTRINAARGPNRSGRLLVRPDEGQDADLPHELSLVRYMVASARFPLVTPPLRVPQAPGENTQFTDGGFFDDSGVEAVWDIVASLGGERRIRVVMLNTVRPDAPWASPPELGAKVAAPAPAAVPPRQVHGLVGTPASAFLGSWRARLARVQERFETERAPFGSNVSVCSVDIRLGTTQAQNFTLGWYLSEASKGFIEASIDAEFEKPTACVGPRR